MSLANSTINDHPNFPDGAKIINYYRNQKGKALEEIIDEYLDKAYQLGVHTSTERMTNSIKKVFEDIRKK